MATAYQDDYMKTALRLPRDLHAKIQEAATASGKSLNSELIHRLQQSFEGNVSTDLALVLASLESVVATSLVEKMDAEYNAALLAAAVRQLLRGEQLSGEARVLVEMKMKEALTAPSYRVDAARTEQTLTAQQIADARVRMLAAAMAVRDGQPDPRGASSAEDEVARRVAADAARHVPGAGEAKSKGSRTKRKA